MNVIGKLTIYGLGNGYNNFNGNGRGNGYIEGYGEVNGDGFGHGLGFVDGNGMGIDPDTFGKLLPTGDGCGNGISDFVNNEDPSEA
jgi:hypothetical protein